jgi:hypothetical protein
MPDRPQHAGLSDAGFADQKYVLMIACRFDEVVDDGFAGRWKP